VYLYVLKFDIIKYVRLVSSPSLSLSLSPSLHSSLSHYLLTHHPHQSKTLDLFNPASFRDLSKPIGALNPERLKGTAHSIIAKWWHQ
jgi:hypothetical protein